MPQILSVRSGMTQNAEISTRLFPLPLMEQKVMTNPLAEEQLDAGMQKSSEPISDLMTEEKLNVN